MLFVCKFIQVEQFAQDIQALRNRGAAASALESEVSTHLCILLACISVVICAVNWPLQMFVCMIWFAIHKI
jgi:hypothetical protein